MISSQELNTFQENQNHQQYNVKFPIFKGACLQDFSEYITDIDNAPDVFSSPSYEVSRISGINQEIADKDVLRKEGATFRLKGMLYPKVSLFKLGVPVDADFEVSIYKPDSHIKVISRRIKTPYFNSDVLVEIDWNFLVLEDGFSPKLTVNIHNLPIEKLPVFIRNKYDSLVKEELRRLAENITDKFWESRGLSD